MQSDDTTNLRRLSQTCDAQTLASFLDHQAQP